MLDVLDLTTARHAAAEATHEERRLLVYPSLLLVLGVWITPMEVIRLA